MVHLHMQLRTIQTPCQQHASTPQARPNGPGAATFPGACVLQEGRPQMSLRLKQAALRAVGNGVIYERSGSPAHADAPGAMDCAYRAICWLLRAAP